MPIFSATELQSFASSVLTRLGMPDADSAMTAELLVEANLVGHDSHGVLRLIQYAQQARAGQLRFGRELLVLRESAATALFDGQMNIGHVTLLQVLEQALAKAAQTDVAMVAIRNCHHVGRLGAFVDRAARRGFGAILAVNSPSGRCVIPWGGMDRRMGTNPIAMGFPTRGTPLVFDATTSVVAEGKLRHYHQQKAPVPEGWIVDCDGQPATDPSVFYRQPPGALLPLGGSLGYKGFGLSLMIDVLCGSLSGQGGYRADLSPGHNGVWMTVFRIEAFADWEDYYQDVDKLISWIKSSRKLPEVAEILLPGENEARIRARRETEGIEVPDGTWQLLQNLVAELQGLKTSS